MANRNRSRTFRVFVSSTFSDMKVERNALQDRVFPRLRDLCEKHGCHFQPIDLRWGVSEEAGLSQQTMEICLQELNRCRTLSPRPSFIVLLGERYGWRPLPYRIAATEFEELLSHVKDADEREFLLYDETPLRTDSGRGWYRRDNNAMPAEYVLQPRILELPDNPTVEQEKELREIERLDWEKHEPRIRQSLIAAMEAAGWTPDDDRRKKYQQSATHQEVEFGALYADAMDNAFAYFRESGTRGNGSENESELEDLKNQIQKRSPNQHVYRFPDSSDSSLALLCNRVESDLWAVIHEEIGAIESQDPLKYENDTHREFAESYARHFVGRANERRAIHRYVESRESHPLFVCGVSGSGKTALTARAYLDHQALNTDGNIVIGRMIGATPNSTNLRDLLKELCAQLHVALGFEERKREELEQLNRAHHRAPRSEQDVQKRQSEIEEKYSIGEELEVVKNSFQRFVDLIPAGVMTCIFLDAIDQLEELRDIHNLNWLPRKLPDHVRIIASVLNRPDDSAGDLLQTLWLAFPPSSFLSLQPLPLDDVGNLLDNWLADSRRTIQPAQRRAILSPYEERGLPLWLRLAFEESLRWKSYDVVFALPASIPELIGQVLDRLSLPQHHGRLMLARSLAYLAAARHGLSEGELLDVLAQDEDVWRWFQATAYHEIPRGTRRLPFVLWSRLNADLRAYLTELRADETILVGFYHRLLREAVESRYLSTVARNERHHELATYFLSQRLEKGDSADSGERSPHIRKLMEAPYQAILAQRWKDVVGYRTEPGLLTDLEFFAAKCEAGLTYELLSNYAAALQTFPDARVLIEKECERHAQLERYLNGLISYSRSWHEMRRKRWSKKRFSLRTLAFRLGFSKDRSKYDRDCLQLPPAPPAMRSATGDAESRTPPARRTVTTRLDHLTAFSQFANSEAHNLLRFGGLPGNCVQQAYNSGRGGYVTKAAESLVRNCRRGVMLLSVDRKGDDKSTPALVKTLEWHTKGILDACISADGGLAVTVTVGEPPCVWDLKKGARVQVLEELRRGANCVRLTADAKSAFTIQGHSSRSSSLDAWSLASGQRIFRGMVEGVALSITPDGVLAVTANDDHSLRTLDLETGESRCTRKFKERATCLSMTPDGMSVAAGHKNILCIWDLESGTCQTELTHPAVISEVSITPNGLLAFCRADDTVYVWDLLKNACRCRLQSAVDTISGFAVTVDGRLGVTIGKDFSHRTHIRAWDLETGDCLKTIVGEEYNAYTVSVTPDGRTAITGGGDNALRVWDLECGSSSRPETSAEEPRCFNEFSPDGSRRVSLRRNTLEVFDCNDQQGLYKGRVVARSASITPDGQLVVWVGETLRPVIWRLGISDNPDFLAPIAPLCSYVCVTPDGMHVVSDVDNTHDIVVWNIVADELLFRMKGHTGSINAVRVTPDGKSVVTGSWDRTVRIWDMRSQECLRVFEGHKDVVNDVQVTPDGKRAVSCSNDRTIRVWDLDSGRCVAVYPAPRDVKKLSRISAHGQIECSLGGTGYRKLDGYNLSGIPVVTPTRIWIWRTKDKGEWDASLSVGCPWCQARFRLTHGALHELMSIGQESATLSCLTVPREAWDNPRLEADCTHCSQRLRMNPFVCDNQGLR